MVLFYSGFGGERGPDVWQPVIIPIPDLLDFRTDAFGCCFVFSSGCFSGVGWIVSHVAQPDAVWST